MEHSFDLEFDWHLTNRCNFFCEYCHPQIRRVLNKQNLNEPEYSLVVSRFNELAKTCYIHMSGGEPFLFPSFASLCEGLTAHHFISINTNLSHDVSQFVTQIDPSRVLFITAAIHIAERERNGEFLETFITNARLLQDKGFKISTIYISYPPLISRMERDIAQIRSAGIHHVNAKVFKGSYLGKRYPDSYLEHERNVILKCAGTYQFNRPYLDGKMGFKGQVCNAGRSSFKIMVNGDVHRCATVQTKYGNLYDGTFVPAVESEPCSANRVLVVSQCHRYLVNAPETATSPANTTLTVLDD